MAAAASNTSRVKTGHSVDRRGRGVAQISTSVGGNGNADITSVRVSGSHATNSVRFESLGI